MAALESVDWAGCILFFLEVYHVLTHYAVLFGRRLLPRKDLVRVRWYFLFDTMTIFTVNFLYLQKLQWLAGIQMIQHFSYFIWWDKANFCKHVISWSSLDWYRTFAHRYDWEMILGTTFDFLCHLINAALIYHNLSFLQMFLSLFACQLLFLVVLYNPRFAWSNPNQVPAWVEKRITHLTEDRGIEFVEIQRVNEEAKQM